MNKMNEQANKSVYGLELYVVTGLVDAGVGIDEAFTKLFKDKKLAIEYVKGFVDEAKDNFSICQVEYGKDYAYTGITAGDYSEYTYTASLTIEKQRVQ